MCTRFPLDCALRDHHAGHCMRPAQLEAAIAEYTSNLAAELTQLPTPHQDQRP